MLFDPPKEQKNIQPFSRNLKIFNFQNFFQNVYCKSMIGLSIFFYKNANAYRAWNSSPRNEFAEKLCKKTGGAFLNFPRFAAAHCRRLQAI